MTQPQNTPTPSAGAERAKQITIGGSILTLVVFLIFAFIAITSVKGMLIALFVGLPITIALAAVTFIAQKAAQL